MTLYHVTLAGRTLAVELSADGVSVDGEPHTVELVAVPGGSVHSLLLDGASHRLSARPLGGGLWDLRLGGRLLRVEVADERTRRIRELAGPTTGAVGPQVVHAPMPGLVLRVDVAVGDVVRAGQGVVIVEAMKMENELRAAAEGRVQHVHVSPGQTVERGQALIEFVPLEEQ